MTHMPALPENVKLLTAGNALREAPNFVLLTEEEGDALFLCARKELGIDFFALHMEEERDVLFLTAFDQLWEEQIFAHPTEEAENVTSKAAQNQPSLLLIIV